LFSLGGKKRSFLWISLSLIFARGLSQIGTGAVCPEGFVTNGTSYPGRRAIAPSLPFGPADDAEIAGWLDCENPKEAFQFYPTQFAFSSQAPVAGSPVFGSGGAISQLTHGISADGLLATFTENSKEQSRHLMRTSNQWSESFVISSITETQFDSSVQSRHQIPSQVTSSRLAEFAASAEMMPSLACSFTTSSRVLSAECRDFVPSSASEDEFVGRDDLSDASIDSFSLFAFQFPEDFDARPKPDQNETLLVASHNGNDTDAACDVLNRYVLGGQGVKKCGCIRGLSYMDDNHRDPDNLTICDVGNGRAVPNDLRRADGLILVYGGDRTQDRENFRNLRALHSTLIAQMVNDPVIVLLNLDFHNVTVSEEEEIAIKQELHAQRVVHRFLTNVDLDSELWIHYGLKRGKEGVLPAGWECSEDCE
jgi:hypothetical protein